MDSNSQLHSNPKWMTVTGWIIGALPATLLIAGSPMSILKMPMAIEGMKQYGYPEGAIVPIGISALVSGILYLIPKTSMLGAILLTGYLGRAVATHVRAGESSFVIAITFGILFWGGLWLRNPALRAQFPLRAK